MLENKTIIHNHVGWEKLWNSSCNKKNNADMQYFLIGLLSIKCYGSTKKIQNNVKIGQLLFVL